MLKGIDVSYTQGDLEFLPSSVNPEFCFCKATEATCIVDDSCDRMVQDCIAHDIPFGFYHFANGSNNATQQARFFRNNTKWYEGKGIPILEFEVKYPNSFIDEFVKEYHAITGVFPLVYMNASFNTAMSVAITLSETAANFSRLVICYNSDHWFFGSVEVYHTNGKKVALTMNVPDKSGFITTKGKCVYINGTDVNTYASDGFYYCGQGYVKSEAGYDNVDKISITQVIGYR